MKNFTTALYLHATTDTVGSGFMSSIGSRFYEDEAPLDAEFPYAVYSMPANVKDWQFTERFRDILLQISIFSITSGSTEIKDIYAKLLTLYDECTFSITGSTLKWFWFNNLTTMKEEFTTPTGTHSGRHYAVDFDIYLEVG